MFLDNNKSVHVYVCGMPNIKFVSLECMPNKPKSVKCKNGICICIYLSVCVCVYVYLYFFVCGMCVIYKLSIFGMYAK